MHAFVQQGTTTGPCGIGVPAGGEVRLQSVEVAVPYAYQRDTAELARLNDGAQVSCNRIETLRKALHERDAGGAHGPRDAVTGWQINALRLLTQDSQSPARGALHQLRMHHGFAADRHASAARQQRVDVVEEVGAKARSGLSSARDVGIPHTRQRTARGEYLAPEVRVVVREGQHADLHRRTDGCGRVQGSTSATLTCWPPSSLDF